MEIGSKVIHKYNKLKTGQVVDLGTGSFTGQFKVRWNDGNTYHHLLDTLVQDPASPALSVTSAKAGTRAHVIDAEEVTVAEDATDGKDGAELVETADEEERL